MVAAQLSSLKRAVILVRAEESYFYKPHPVEKIDPVIFRSMGKRIIKWFGWHRDLFVLETLK
jgi:hypothetical protein